MPRCRMASSTGLAAGTSGTGQLSLEVSEIHGEGVHPFTGQGEEKISAVEARDLGRFLLRNLTAGVPMDGSRKAQLASELARRAAKR